MKLAVVGATGLVGGEMLKVIEARNFPFDELYLVASERSIGKEIEFKGNTYKVIGLREAVDIKPDIAIFSAALRSTHMNSPKSIALLPIQIVLLFRW